MKMHRVLSFLIYSVLALVVGGLGWSVLFRSGPSGGSSMGYGNLTIAYWWESRGILDERVNYLIVTPDRVTQQDTVNERGGVTFRFENGKEYHFLPDSKALIWIDAKEGVQKLPTKLTRSMMDQIHRTQEQEKETVFDTPESFLAALDNDAEQGGAGGR